MSLWPLELGPCGENLPCDWSRLQLYWWISTTLCLVHSIRRVTVFFFSLESIYLGSLNTYWMVFSNREYEARSREEGKMSESWLTSVVHWKIRASLWGIHLSQWFHEIYRIFGIVVIKILEDSFMKSMYFQCWNCFQLFGTWPSHRVLKAHTFNDLETPPLLGYNVGSPSYLTWEFQAHE